MTDDDVTERIYNHGAVIGSTASGLQRRTAYRVVFDEVAGKTHRQRRIDAEVARHLAEVAHEWRLAPNHPPSPGTMRSLPLPAPRRRRWWPGR